MGVFRVLNSIVRNGKRYYTNLFVVVVMLAFTDIVFAVDSIPAVFAIVTESPQRNMIIYTSNIFAVLGLRSLFFVLRGAVHRVTYLQQGIAIVLISHRMPDVFAVADRILVLARDITARRASEE